MLSKIGISVELLKHQIENTLQLRPELVAEAKNEADILALIERLVQELIDSDFEKLLLLLYRIDVNEKKVKEAIDLAGPEKASLSIAKLILEREKQKAASREKYKSESPDWEF